MTPAQRLYVVCPVLRPPDALTLGGCAKSNQEMVKTTGPLGLPVAIGQDTGDPIPHSLRKARPRDRSDCGALVSASG